MLSRSRRWLRWWPLLLLAVPAVLLAHAHLVRSAPAAGARLQTSPTTITLWFSEAPQLAFSRVELVGADSAVVPLSQVAMAGTMGISASVMHPLPAGTYTVVWRTGAADGHLSHGRFSFSVATAAGATAAAQQPETSVTMHGSRMDRAADRKGNDFVRVRTSTDSTASADQQAVTRWVEFVALLTVVGAIVLRLLLLRGLERRGTIIDAAESARRLAQAALVLAAIALLSRLDLESQLVFGPAGALRWASLRQVMFASSWGHGWLLGACGVIVTTIGLFAAARSSLGGWYVAVVGAIAMVLAPALTGHAAAQPDHRALAIAADALHVAGGCVWLGTLLAIVLATIPVLLRLTESARGPATLRLFQAFSPIALSGAGLVVLTGVISAYLHLTRFSDLWTTSYGSLLFRKLVFFVVVVLLGAWNWRRVTPSLGDPGSPRRMRRTAASELLVVAVVLAFTAILVGTATPQPADVPASTALRP